MSIQVGTLTRRLTASTGVLALLCGASLVDATSAAADTGSSAVVSSPSNPNAIKSRVLDLVGRTPSGADIRVAMYIFNDLDIARALESAADRGVRVKVVVDHLSDESATHYTAFRELQDHIGATTTAASYAVSCPVGVGCIGTRDRQTPSTDPANPDQDSVHSINHNKFFLFSRLTDGTANVVVQSSENLDARAKVGGFGAWNSAAQINGNAGLYNGYAAYHTDLTAMGPDNDYYRTVESGNAKAYFFPEASQNPDWPSEPATDSVISRLNGVVCKGNSPGFGTSDGRTVVRVGMNLFSRYEIAKKLQSLDQDGCWVEVLYQLPKGYSAMTSTDASRKVTAALTAPFNAYNGPVVHTFPESANDATPFHSKFLLVKGGYDDGSAQVRDRKILWTGSHNYTFNSLRDSDETFVKLEDSTAFDTYENFFKSALPSATCTWIEGTWSPAGCN
ncbi:phosphatidylserine/phosphatidylglycerophosphate/cardiolipin synthase-like enzyme [Streptomyces sp. BK022]|uniref:phospholipase D-like domain-containing protein n=1 Tax=Streptomyces sp. BK022 TaxID=2512123 RepID=UPI00102894FF|nr:phospholipase D-like domain-containing protein [Streptomyces sp. BK022]RZU30245.1 phosphatidylserine/phosphatidylglycerophosphate/cardiolipin synthase-like enzyme [Streptomyces sp. BK022]